MDDNSYKVIDVDINEILPNRFQPRIQFDEEEILELSDSIKEHGVIQPLVVRTIGDKYEIIAGERRYKASVLAGKDTVPVIIKNLNDKDSAEIALIENIQRKNLTPIEEAISYKKILDMGYLTQETLANKLGKSQSSVANKIRLLNLSDEIQEALLDNKISERHARSLLRLKSLTEQNKMLDKILQERLTVRKADEQIDKILNNEVNFNEKIKEEKGELNMNNQLNQVSSSSNAFDIFGSANLVEMPNASVVEQPKTGGFQFDASGNVTASPNITTEMSSAPVMPTIEPVIEQPKIGGFQFDASGNVTASPSITTETPSAPVMPTIEPVVEQPKMGGFQFDASGNVTAEPSITTETPSAPVMPTIEPVVEQPKMGGFQFDASGNMSAEPSITTEMSSAPVMPTIEPVIEQPKTGGFQFDALGNVTAEPSITTEMSSAPVMPTIEPVVEQPKMGGFQFDALGNVTAEPSITTETPSAPVMPTIESTEIPLTSPIIDNTSSTTVESSVSPIIPEPIIITDYSKQYDPIMPESIIDIPEKVDFKEVINVIRECSKKIEKFGYKIDVEEYDLSTLYQVVFKVEK